MSAQADGWWQTASPAGCWTEARSVWLGPAAGWLVGRLLAGQMAGWLVGWSKAGLGVALQWSEARSLAVGEPVVGQCVRFILRSHFAVV